MCGAAAERIVEQLRGTNRDRVGQQRQLGGDKEHHTSKQGNDDGEQSQAREGEAVEEDGLVIDFIVVEVVRAMVMRFLIRWSSGYRVRHATVVMAG